MNRTKTQMSKSIRIFIFTMLIGTTFLSARDNGIGLIIGYRGYGFFAKSSHIWRPKYTTGFQAQFLDVTGSNEFKISDPYTGYTYTINSQSLVLLPFFYSVSYFPFEGKIDNQFSPFITGKAGFLVAADGDESINSWAKRWSQPKFSFAPAFQFGGGATFILPMSSAFTFTVVYSLYPMPRVIDGQSNYNGLSFEFGFSR